MTFLDIDKHLSLKDFYPVNVQYKEKQRSSTGRLIPFEQIDKSIYKKKANCVCFKTTNNRIHAWIIALHESLYLGFGVNGKYKVVWRDHEEDDKHIISTEFILSDHDEEFGDVLKYKVFVYLTTGKIMVQGTAYEKWCDSEFDKCRQKVDKLLELVDSEKKTLVQEIIPEESEDTDSLCSEPHHDDSEETKLLKPYPPVDNQEKGSEITQGAKQLYYPPVDCQEKGSEITLSGQFEKLFGHVNNRISVIEESVLKLTTTVTSFIDSMTRQPRPNEIDRLNEKLDRLERDNESNRNQVSELIKQNGILKRKIEELESRNSLKDIEWRQRNRKLAEDVETTRLNAKLTVDEMSSKLRLAEGQLQQKTSSNLELEDKIDNLQEKISDLSSENKAYKDRIKDKDILINNLQDRLQTMKYDSEGGSWIVHNRVNSSPTRDSASYIFPTSTSQTSATDTEEHPPTDDIVLLHDSICKHVNMSQLTAGSDLKGSEIKCSTLEAVSETVRRINKSVPHVVIHVGVNDLRKPHSSVDDVFSKYCQTVHDVSSKSDKITLSLLLPCDEQPLCSNIMALNNLIITKFLKTEKNSKISVCMNDNFTSAGILNSKLFEDSVHINREGTKVLCSNLKRSMNLQNKQAERPGGFRGRQRNSMRNQQNTMGNRPNSIPRHNGQKSGQSQMADQLAQALLGLMSQ